MAKKMNLNESLVLDDEFTKWLEMSDKMYEDLAQQPVVPGQQPTQPQQQQPQGTGSSMKTIPTGQPQPNQQQAQTTPQPQNQVKALADTWLKQLQATTKDPNVLNSFQAFVKTLKP
jgi:hypothetical protein